MHDPPGHPEQEKTETNVTEENYYPIIKKWIDKLT